MKSTLDHHTHVSVKNMASFAFFAFHKSIKTTIIVNMKSQFSNTLSFTKYHEDIFIHSTARDLLFVFTVLLLLPLSVFFKPLFPSWTRSCKGEQCR